MEHRRCFVTDEQPSQPLTSRARSLANLKRYPKGQTGNPSGRPKDLANFGAAGLCESSRNLCG